MNADSLNQNGRALQRDHPSAARPSLCKTRCFSSPFHEGFGFIGDLFYSITGKSIRQFPGFATFQIVAFAGMEGRELKSYELLITE
jgi:hypothetical protein